MNSQEAAAFVVGGEAAGRVLALSEGLSFWGGVDPASGRIIDVHHPQHGADLSGAVVLMSTTRGSCSGSGVVLGLALAGEAPAALVFKDAEDVATLGARVAREMFGCSLPVLRLPAGAYDALSRTQTARIGPETIVADDLVIPIVTPAETALVLSSADRAMLAGDLGEAPRQAMRILLATAHQQGAAGLIDVTRVHIDGCIYSGPGNLDFAEAMAALGARVRVPTTMNAISIDRENWRRQHVPEEFGVPAARLADAYLSMGCQATFTCAPYLLDDAPTQGEAIGWAESNAVVYANTVLGARTAKHPDFLDLCIALTGRAPLNGPYLEDGRRAELVIDVDLPADAGPEAWPLIGYLVGLSAPDRIPLVRGVAAASPNRDDLKALCAAFGTSSAAPMLHIAGVTPEAEALCALVPDTPRKTLTHADLVEGWQRLNAGPEPVDLIAIGSPHASLDECRALATMLDGRPKHPGTSAIVTAGRSVIATAEADGTRARLHESGVVLIPDLCWCSILPPVFPATARTVMTTSGKYAHYGPGLSGCSVRLGTLDDCVEALVCGRVPSRLPRWMHERIR